MPRKFLYDLWRELPIPDYVRYGFVRLFFPKFLIGVNALIINDQNECLLFKHSYRKKTPWGLPGGYLKKGENPEDAIKREIAEESGFQVNVIDFLYADSSTLIQRVDLVYICRLAGEQSFTISSEVIEAKFFPLDNLPALIPQQVEIIHKLSQRMLKNGTIQGSI